MKYLIVYCGHEDSTSANGVCVWNIAKELRSRGHEVWAIWQYKDIAQRDFEKNDVHCYSINESWYYTFTQWHKEHRNFLYDFFYKLVSLFRLFYAMPLYPNISPLVAMKSFRLADKIIRDKGIDRVLGIYMPYHAIKATLLLKNRYKEKLYVTNYHLDLVNSPINTNHLVKRYKLWKGNNAVKKELKEIDRLLLPMSVKGVVESKKIEYVDFPLFVQNHCSEVCDFVFPNDSINISYVGSLDKSNRNPSYTLSLLKKCSEISQKIIKLHIWGNLADKETRDILNCYDFVYYHGLLKNDYVQDILSRSDCLLNVSNAVTYNMIPSKIFQLFSMHKPIINIVRNEKDSSLRYFSIYPNVINVFEYNQSKEVVRNLLGFLMNKDGEIKYNDDLYVRSTPGYICDILDGTK